MEKMYIIGGSGFIGKNLVEYFLESYDITVVDKYIDDGFFCRHPQVRTLRIELDREQIPQDAETPDYIVNLASIVTAERDLSLFDGMISSNLKVLLNLFERFRGDGNLKLFIQFGSSEEYGNEGSPFVEGMREVPNSPYALVKQLTVNTALMLQRNYGFPAMSVRPGNVFGRYQNSGKFIPYVISRLRAGEILDVTLCEQKRDFIYASDFAWCIGELVKNYRECIGEIVNVASGESVSLKWIIDTCKQIMKSRSPIHYGALSYRENEVMDLKCSVEKLSSMVNQEIQLDIKQRLTEYINEQGL